jgi:hypothetical protein
MPKIDFSNISNAADFDPLPDGQYQVKLADIETDRTKHDDVMWKLRWKVEGGEFCGRLIFDNMVFTEKAMPRVKMICACCGIDVSGELDLQPEMLLDKQVFVHVFQEQYKDDKDQEKTRNGIPYRGYEPGPKEDPGVPF